MLWMLALLLLVNSIPGLLRVVRGPTTPDRMVGVLLFGSTGVALLLVAAQALDSPSVRDVALVLAVLAALAAVVFARLGGPQETHGERAS